MAVRRIASIVLLSAAALAGVAFYVWHAPDEKPSRATPRSRRPPVVTGQVVDEEGPVAGAIVRWKGSQHVDMTDEQGRYELPLALGRLTAWKEGYFIGGSEASSGETPIHLVRLPSEDHAGYQWIDPTPDPGAEHNCGNCHEETYRQWQHGGHARSARNPRFLMIYENLLAEMPDGRAVCASCHAPSLDFDSPASEDLRLVSGVAAQGVHCDFCHKVRDVSTDHIGLAHGRFGVQLLRPREGQLFFGPLDDVDRGEDAYAPVYQESRYCSACHEGTLFGVHVYGTYSEWLASPARSHGKECQSCHMPSEGRSRYFDPCNPRPHNPPALASHTMFPGGKEAMLRRALQVTVDLRREGEGVCCLVDLLASDVGHRVPTGFIDRHLILTVEAFDAKHEVVASQSGPVLPQAAGDLAGRPGRLFAKLLTDQQGRGPIPFWRAAAEPIDTRLVPDQAVAARFVFPETAARFRVRLLYRPFWHETAIAQHEPTEEIVVFDQEFTDIRPETPGIKSETPGMSFRWRPGFP